MLKAKLHSIYSRILVPHPLSVGIGRENVETVLLNFLAMSTLFPHIQAAAHEELLFKSLDQGQDLTPEFEATAVVAAFLCWDEFGGHHKICSHGLSGLPGILETRDFHANLLKKNMAHLLGRKIKFACPALTREYMQKLKRGLASENASERVAYMVAFEMNASDMIAGLYQSLKQIYGEDAQHLDYFEIHIGGADPAEAYHVEMTSRLVEAVVGPHQVDAFLTYFAEACELNRDWNQAIKTPLAGNWRKSA